MPCMTDTHIVQRWENKHGRASHVLVQLAANSIVTRPSLARVSAAGSQLYSHMCKYRGTQQTQLYTYIVCVVIDAQAW